MQSKTVKIPNIGCDGCVNTIKMEVGEVAGVVAVTGDSATKMVTIQWDAPSDWQAIADLLSEIDYAPEGD